MDENTSLGPNRPRFIARKRVMAALLPLTLALSFLLLFAPGRSTHAAPTVPVATTDYTHLVVSIVRPVNPIPYSTIAPLKSLSLEARVTPYGSSVAINRVEFYDAPDGINSPTYTRIGDGQLGTSSFILSWTPPVSDPNAAGYQVIAKAYDTEGHVATSSPLFVDFYHAISLPQPLPIPIVTIISPSDGVYTWPAQIPFTVNFENLMGAGSGTNRFYATLSTSSTPTLVDTSTGPTVTWVPPQPGLYYLRVDVKSGAQSGSSDTIAVLVNPAPSPTPPPSPTSAPTPMPSPPPLTVTITSPANGSVYTLPAKIPFSASIGGVIGSNNFMFVINFTATLLPNGPTYRVGTVTQNDSRTFSVTWVPPQAGTYSLVVTAYFIDEAGAQSGTSAPAIVQITAPSCTVSYQLESQWSGGFNTNVVLTNTSSAPINGWMLAFTFLGDQKITNLWNGSYTQTGEQVSIANVGYNSSIAPGGTVNFGFNGSWVSNNSSPTLFTLNGMACSTK